MGYERPNFKEKYENFIGGKWVAPVDGEYFENYSPIDGSLISQIPKSNEKDIFKPLGWLPLPGIKHRQPIEVTY